ncbi:MAG: cofactor-independent phosphoglycerate mutase, partial [bacterium]
MKTKYLVLIGDGMADYPMPELGGKTVLEHATTPNMDYLASHSQCGLTLNTPKDIPPGSDVAILSIFGYDPAKYYTGRGPLEAASKNIKLSDSDQVYRCNIVTIENEIMQDYSAGHISTPEASELIDSLNKELGSDMLRFYSGVSYRHLLVIKKDMQVSLTTPPHDISGKKIGEYLPKGRDKDFILELMESSKKILKDHPINLARISAGKMLATQIWLWGGGKKPSMPTYKKRFNKNGAVITAVDLIRGIGKILGLEVIDVPGATGYLDTNYLGKAEYALKALEKKDFVLVHVEAPDEAGHNGDMGAKIQAIEDFDKLVVGTVLDNIKDKDIHYRMLVLPDHATPISLRTHSHDPVPYILYDNKIKMERSIKYCEKDISALGNIQSAGYRLIEKLFEPCTELVHGEGGM